MDMNKHIKEIHQHFGHKQLHCDQCTYKTIRHTDKCIKALDFIVISAHSGRLI